MDFQSAIMGFGFGGVIGAVIADFIGMPYMQTALFIICGVVGAVAVVYTGEGLDFSSLFG